jgi:hypothetical protein
LTRKHEFEHAVKLDVEARVRKGVKAVLEEVLEGETAEHLKADVFAVGNGVSGRAEPGMGNGRALPPINVA